jgi:hypothetical protein
LDSTLGSTVTLHDGRVLSIDHLAPFEIKCPCEPIDRDLTIWVHFQNHCYTEDFDESKHIKEHILCWDSPTRPRVFCEDRYDLSHKLRPLLTELPKRRVHQTTQIRNYVYVVPLEIEGHIYEIYFMLQRAQGKDVADLRLTIESAYPVEVPTPLPKRPNAIRFFVLAHKVLTNQPIRFAPR